ncbi:MAG TPA: hypothetical protein VNI57_00760 [Candidatus Saccharimonadales bacterium]|nr:hypothetical protein [Candidatus Saccharimonadales bacterium]
MLKRSFVVMLGVFVVAATASLLLAAPKGSTHQGEIVGVDKDAKTITIRLKDTGTGDTDTKVYHVTANTVFKDKDDKPITLDAIQAGMKVRFKSLHKEKEKQLLELEVRPEKG